MKKAILFLVIFIIFFNDLALPAQAVTIWKLKFLTYNSGSMEVCALSYSFSTPTEQERWAPEQINLNVLLYDGNKMITFAMIPNSFTRESCPISDTDGDGTPDDSDPDIDGDGIGNDQDSDPYVSNDNGDGGDDGDTGDPGDGGDGGSGDGGDGGPGDGGDGGDGGDDGDEEEEPPPECEFSPPGLLDAFVAFLPDVPESMRLSYILAQIAGGGTLAGNAVIVLISGLWQFLAILLLIKLYKLLPFT